VVANITLEYLELKFNIFERFVTGKSKIVVENGKLNIKNLKNLRLTVDQLEMRMRNHGITKIEDVKTATLEPNGQLGYELNDDAKPLTVGEFKKLLEIHLPTLQNSDQSIMQKPSSVKENIFEEINSKKPQNHQDYLN
jgi:uncharacterized membrane protein YcaP (DUF421 family)